MTRRTAAAALALLGLAACDETPLQFVCDSQPSPAVAVFVVDVNTRASLAGAARGSYTVAGLRDSLRHRSTGEGEFLAAFGAGGFYDVEIRVDGFAPWSARSVRVPEGVCGPGTVRLVAEPAALP